MLDSCLNSLSSYWCSPSIPSSISEHLHPLRKWSEATPKWSMTRHKRRLPMRWNEVDFSARRSTPKWPITVFAIFHSHLTWDLELNLRISFRPSDKKLFQGAVTRCPCDSWEHSRCAINKIITCCLTRDFKSLFHRLECDDKIHKAHRLKDSKESINKNEGPRCGEAL